MSRPGDVACVTGTSTVLLGIADHLIVDPAHRYLVTPLAGHEGWGFEMDLLTTGSAFRWLAGRLREAADDEATLMAIAAGVEPGAGGLAFLPYLAPGEQGALWDPTISGALFGLSLGHGAADVARALVDGVVLESRRCLAVLDQAGLPRGAVRMAGRSGADPTFRRQLADACRRTVVYAADGETAHSAIGAAAVAAVAVGHGPLPAAAPAALETIEPDEARAARWDELWSATRPRCAPCGHRKRPTAASLGFGSSGSQTRRLASSLVRRRRPGSQARKLASARSQLAPSPSVLAAVVPLRHGS